MAHPGLQDDPFPMVWERPAVRGWFSRRLEGRPQLEIQLLGARAALRSAPQLHRLLDLQRLRGEDTRERLLLACLHCYPISVGAALVPPTEIVRFRYAASRAASTAASAAAAAAASSAASAYHAASSAAEATGSAAAAAAAAAASAAAAHYASSTTAAAAAAFEQDCLTLSSGDLQRLATARLWPRLSADILARYKDYPGMENHSAGMPLPLRETWDRARERLRSLPDDFAVWEEWHEGILAGADAGRFVFDLPTERALRLNVDFALIDNAIWEGEPAALHAEMRRLIQVARKESEEAAEKESAEDASIPIIPEAKPSALEAVWEDGRLILPAVPVVPDSAKVIADAALKALKVDFSDLALDAEGEANIDKRAITYLRRLGDRIPDSAPSNFDLHRIAQNETALQSYGKLVTEEWPEILAVRYHALTLQFTRTMRQFPAWREFKLVAATEQLTPEQINAAPIAAAEFAKALREPDIAEIVDEALPDALETFGAMARDEVEFDAVALGKDLLAADILASIETIAIRIAEGALAAKRGLFQLAGEAWEAFSERAKKSIVEQAKRAGDAVGPLLAKWLLRLVKYGPPAAGAYVGGTPLLIWLAETFPKWFGWLIHITKVFS